MMQLFTGAFPLNPLDLSLGMWQRFIVLTVFGSLNYRSWFFLCLRVFVCLAGQTSFAALFSRCQLCKQKLSSLRAVCCCLDSYIKKRIRSNELVLL